MVFAWDDEPDSDEGDGYTPLAAWAAPTPTLAGRIARCRPGWFDRAACRGVDPDLFYPALGDNCGPAKAVCSTCPVVGPCGELATANSEAFGIWAGRNRRREVGG